MKFGYVRVSTHEQNIDLQLNAILNEGVLEKNIYIDKVSGNNKLKPNLKILLSKLRENDMIIVWKLDRIGRSLHHIISFVSELEKQKIGFKSITEDFIDTSDGKPYKKLLLAIFGALAQFERDLIIERTKAGLNAARRRGEVLGRPKGLSKKAERKACLCVAYYTEERYAHLTVKDICNMVGVSKATLYKYLRQKGVEVGKKKL